MDLELIARTTAVLVSASIVAALLRRAAPSTRHFVWQLAIVIVLLAPLLIALAPTITVPLVPELPRVPEGIVLNAVPEVRSQEHVTQQNSAFGTFGTVGGVGTGAVLVWFGLCWLLSGVSVWRGSRPAPAQWLSEARTLGHRMGLKKPVRVRQTMREMSPHVAGFFHSVVMMPPSAASWTAEARQAALVHELTHIKRGDRRTQAIAQLACAIYWFNPLVWHAAAGLSRERERACDDEVLRFGAKPSAYATLLLDLARKPRSPWTPATALSMARPSAIEGRVLSILADAVRTPRRSTRWLVGFGIVAVTTTILGAQAAKPMPAPAMPAAKPQPIVRPSMVMAFDEPVATPPITGALVQALGDADRQVREQAAIGLAITPGAEVIDPLLNALKDPDSQVREKAAIGLAFRRDPKVVDPLLIAIEDSDSQVREKAAIALGASGDSRAIGALTKATRDPDSQVREKAVAGLVLLRLRR
ncbi:MAG: HEAT repeat domain-containing protein [Cyanobacteria bacterium]|nr:HEAT repeat domain-containing protein [Cyanobacteriota bacterium]